MKGVLFGLAALAVAVVLVIGLSQAGGDSDATPPGPPTSKFDAEQAKEQLAGAPPELAALHAQTSQILTGGEDAFKQRLEELEGHPVVINKWASWCGPCRAEFPIFQEEAVARGKEIAFLGLNSGDSTRDAKKFLARFPVPYPSYEDPTESIARSVKAAKAYPITVFIDAEGEIAYVHQGGYRERADLQADIERYLR